MRADVVEMADKINNMTRDELIRLVAMFIGEYNKASEQRDICVAALEEIKKVDLHVDAAILAEHALEKVREK